MDKALNKFLKNINYQPPKRIRGKGNPSKKFTRINFNIQHLFFKKRVPNKPLSYNIHVKIIILYTLTPLIIPFCLLATDGPNIILIIADDQRWDATDFMQSRMRISVEPHDFHG